MIRPALLLSASLVLLSCLPSASAIPPACDLPPSLPPGGLIADTYNPIRDSASDTCHTAVDSTWAAVVAECEFHLGPTCPL